MSQLEFVALGDLHFEKLDSYFDPDKGVKYVIESIEKVIEYCERNNINRIVQLGDIFDTPFPRQKTIKAFLELISKYPFLQWDCILGNHDFATTKAHSLEICEYIFSLEAFENVNIYTKPTLKTIDGVDVYFAPFPYFELPEVSKTPKLCFGHFEVAGATMDNGMAVKEGVSLKKLGSKNFWIMGHLHRFQKYPRLVYSGTCLQYNFGEPLPKGFLHCKAKVKDNVLGMKYTYNQVQPPYELHNIIINKESDLEQLDRNATIKYYKLFVKKGVELPTSLIQDYPNILKVNGFKNKKEQQQLERNQLAINYAVTEISPLYGLEGFLKTKGFAGDKIKEGTQIVTDIIENCCK